MYITIKKPILKETHVCTYRSEIKQQTRKFLNYLILTYLTLLTLKDNNKEFLLSNIK